MTSVPRRTASIVPLAVLSLAACAHLVQAPTPLASASAHGPAPAGAGSYAAGLAGVSGALAPAALPIELPTSVPAGDGSISATVTTPTAVTTPSSSVDIPAPALAAYQRAETVINAADPTCRLQWQLVAAIGRVESDHGRHGGSVLDSEGRATPAIVGVRLDGSGGTARIVDTDGGELDGDPEFDRAVGPMQFIPSTWASVGVDADGDEVRDPQDIDDAALGAAVYLCSATDDLGTDAGRRAALLRYNHSTAYAEQVLGIMDDYVDADSVLPSSTVLAVGQGTTAPQAGPGLPGLGPAGPSTGPSTGPSGPTTGPGRDSHGFVLPVSVPVGPTRPGTDPVAAFPGGTVGGWTCWGLDPATSPTGEHVDETTDEPTDQASDEATGAPTEAPADGPTTPAGEPADGSPDEPTGACTTVVVPAD